jgi:proliferating cell nuclear antigen
VTPFKISVEKAKVLQDFAAAVNVLVDEATLQLTPEGLTAALMDSSKVALLNIEYPKTLFSEYNISEAEKIALNVTELQKHLKRAGKDDKITIETGKEGKLTLTIENMLKRRWTLPTLLPDETTAPTPKVDFTVKAKLSSAALIQSFEDAALAGDFITFKKDGDKLLLTTQGDLTDADITIPSGSDALLELSGSEDAKAVFSLSFLTDIVKAAGTDGVIIIEYAQDTPMKLDFVLQEGKMEFWLAPRLGCD